ncbi:MAG: hypothetical protein U0263_32045 [Polyangiaceae bacterium]
MTSRLGASPGDIVTPPRTPLVFIAFALFLFGCGSEIQTQWTPYRKYYRLTARGDDCNPHTAFDPHGIPPHVPIATMSRDMGGGIFGTDGDTVIEEFRQQTCAIGADGVIIPADSRSRKFLGGTAVATVFMWARPQQATAAAVSCSPACRAGFLCQSGACVSACNPPCPSAQQCVVTGSSAACVSQPPAQDPKPTPAP